MGDPRLDPTRGAAFKADASFHREPSGLQLPTRFRSGGCRYGDSVEGLFTSASHSADGSNGPKSPFCKF